jgi:HTH-type transcriptional regulator/antitoxin HigA
MNTDLRPARVTPPGRIIRRELEARGWTQKDLAAVVGRPEQTISQIVQGRKQITPETAIQLAAAFGTSPDFWLNLETNYQLHLAREKHDSAGIARKSRLYSLLPVAELVARGWIEAADSPEELEQRACDFLGIATLDEQPRLAVNFRQAQNNTPEVAAEIAWVKRVEHLASAQHVEAYSRDRLREEIMSLLAFSETPEGASRVPAFLKSLGVHFVIVPHLSHTYLDGAAFSLDDHPVVALTLRYDRIDSFWFTLMHELAHIVLGHEGGYLDNIEKQAENPTEEEANRLARDWLVEPGAWTRFVAATRPYFSRERINAFARQIGRHPGIVLGCLHHEGLVPYQNLRQMLLKEKPYLEAWIDVAEPAGPEVEASSGAKSKRSLTH